MDTHQITPNSEFSAIGSLSGYLFQCRYALLDAIRRLKRGSTFSVTIETLDDIVFESPGDAVDVLQTKHHLNRVANLTDASPDLWKTIRIWSEQYVAGKLLPGATLYLITTALAPSNSVAAFLKADSNRDVQGAIYRLNSVAGSSTNADNRSAYTVYKSLTEETKLSLFNSVIVIDAVPLLADLDSVIRQEVYFTVECKYLNAFIMRLDGWWLKRVILLLTQQNIKPVLSEELYEELGHLREQFKQENLPIDDDILAATVDENGYQNRTFVQQLKLIEIGNRRIFFAIRDYFRAFTQRSRWLREELLYIGELDRYEQKLTEEWEIHFEAMRDELGDEATNEEKKRAAQALYRWVEENDLQKIRPMVNDPCISRGSYHILADDLKVGWHLEFSNRLRELLET